RHGREDWSRTDSDPRQDARGPGPRRAGARLLRAPRPHGRRAAPGTSLVVLGAGRRKGRRDPPVQDLLRRRALRGGGGVPARRQRPVLRRRARRPPHGPAEDGGLRDGPVARRADPRGRQRPGRADGAREPRRPRREQERQARGDGRALRRHDGLPRARGGLFRVLRHGLRGHRREPRPRGHRRVRDGRGEPPGLHGPARQADAAVQPPDRGEDAARRHGVDGLPRGALHVPRGHGRRRADRVVRADARGAPVVGGLEDLRLHARAAHRLGAPRAPGEPRRQRLLLAQPQRRRDDAQVHRARPEAPLRQGLVLRPLPPGPGLRGQHHVPDDRPVRGGLPEPGLLRLRPDVRDARRRVARRPPAEPFDPRRRRRLRGLHHRPRARRRRAPRRDDLLHGREPRGRRLRAQPRRRRGDGRDLHEGLQARGGRRVLRDLRRGHGRRRLDGRLRGRRRDGRVVEAQLRPGAGHLRRPAARVRPVDARAVGPRRRLRRARGPARRRRAVGRGGVQDHRRPGDHDGRRPRGRGLRRGRGGRRAGRAPHRRRVGGHHRGPAQRGRLLLAQDRPQQDRPHEGEAPRRGGRAARGRPLRGQARRRRRAQRLLLLGALHADLGHGDQDGRPGRHVEPRAVEDEAGVALGVW
ncbi:expressed protein, partial [Aureococcus anophagefferens]